jgi:hypothetical protein
MKKQISPTKKAHLIRGACYLVMLMAGTMLICFPFKTLATRDQRTLTFEERVAYQRAIEDFTGVTASGPKKILIPSHRLMR